MNTLMLGSQGGSDLDLLTKLLEIGKTKEYDTVLESLVKSFQKENDLRPDGIVGYKTWRRIILFYREKNRPGKEITEWDYDMFSGLLDCEPEVLKAIKEVEAGNKNGFDKTGNPLVRFEGHVFWRELTKLDIDPESIVEGNEDILYKIPDKTKYLSGTKEWSRFEKAAGISRLAAIKSTSWGMFKIMGNNYALCSCSGVTEFYDKVVDSSFSQFLLFIDFLHNTKLHQFLKNHNWEEFAKRLGFSKKSYDKKLKSAFFAFKEQK